MFGGKRTREPRGIRITIPSTGVVTTTKMTHVLLIARALQALKRLTPRAAFPVVPFALTIERTSPEIIGIVLVAHRGGRIRLVLFFFDGGSPTLRALFLITLTLALFPAAMELPIAIRAVLDGIALLQAHIFLAFVKAVAVLLVARTLLPVQLIALGSADVVGPVVIAERILVAAPKVVFVIFMANRHIFFAAGLGHAIPLRFIVALLLLGGPRALRTTLAGEAIVAKRAALG